MYLPEISISFLLSFQLSHTFPFEDFSDGLPILFSLPRKEISFHSLASIFLLFLLQITIFPLLNFYALFLIFPLWLSIHYFFARVLQPEQSTGISNTPTDALSSEEYSLALELHQRAVTSQLCQLHCFFANYSVRHIFSTISHSNKRCFFVVCQLQILVLKIIFSIALVPLLILYILPQAY